MKQLDFNPECEDTFKTRDVFSASSAQTLEQTARSTKFGFSKTVDIGGKVKLGPATVNANTTSTTSLMFGNSNHKETIHGQTSEGAKSSFVMQSDATIYQGRLIETYPLRSDVIDQYKAVTDEAKAHLFANQYGTHYYTNVAMGANFKLTYFTYDEEMALATNKF